MGHEVNDGVDGSVKDDAGEVTLVRVTGAKVDLRAIATADPDHCVRDYDGFCMRARWYTGNQDEEGYRPQATLLVRFEPDLGYRALLERVHERALGDGRMELITTFGDRPHRLFAMPQRQYTAEGMEAAYEAALATLRYRARGDDPEVLRYFTRTGRLAPSGRFRR